MEFWTAIVIISLGSIIILFGVCPAIIIIAAKLIKRGGSVEGNGMADEEARRIQEIYQGLSKMEERVESLETLLLEKERKDKKE